MILAPLFAFALQWNATFGIHSSRMAQPASRALPVVVHPAIPGVPRKVSTVAEAAARRYHVPATLLLAVAKVESRFNPHAVSPAGARGIMQIMPDAARFMRVANVFSIRDSLFGAARYLGGLIHGGMRPANAVFTYTMGHPGTPWQVAHSGYVQAVFHDYRVMLGAS